jgi:hypothetical protein
MERTEAGTTVGVDDPYAHVDRCDHCTDAGRCRFAREQGERDPTFADERARADFRCPVVRPAEAEHVAGARADRAGEAGEWDWADCSHFRCRSHDRTCVRCGLDEVRLAQDATRPLLEAHHLSYRESSRQGATGATPSHEITVLLCRWCHAKVHKSWARIDDDANPDPEAIAAAEARRSEEQAELAFRSAAERADGE